MSVISVAIIQYLSSFRNPPGGIFPTRKSRFCIKNILYKKVRTQNFCNLRCFVMVRRLYSKRFQNTAIRCFLTAVIFQTEYLLQRFQLHC